MKETYLITQTKAFVIHEGSFRIERANYTDDTLPECKLYYQGEDGYSRIIATAQYESSAMLLLRYILKHHVNPDKPIIDLLEYGGSSGWVLPS